MTEGSESEKSKEKRLEETEKWQAETARSLAVARAKEAHKLIEDTEKSRKHSAIFSITDRLIRHADLTNSYSKYLLNMKSEHEDFEITSGDKIYIEDMVRTYESIRYDFQKNMEIKDEEMERLFPKLKADFSEFMIAVTKLMSITDQMIDMTIYCKRMWS
jgi:hypothetical protein